MLSHQELYLKTLGVLWIQILIVVATVIMVVALRLTVRLRRGKFGTRLLIKLAGIFAVVGLLPGLVIYTVSYQFVSRSIQAWFEYGTQSVAYARQTAPASLAAGQPSETELTGLSPDTRYFYRVCYRAAGESASPA
jgi:nitrogen fixation/metabolism regulation signal transduction histidine kinase